MKLTMIQSPSTDQAPEPEVKFYLEQEDSPALWALLPNGDRFCLCWLEVKDNGKISMALTNYAPSKYFNTSDDNLAIKGIEIVRNF